MNATPKAKPWWAEREFIMTVGCVAASIALMYQGKAMEGVALLGSTTGLYSISRGQAKGAVKK